MRSVRAVVGQDTYRETVAAVEAPRQVVRAIAEILRRVAHFVACFRPQIAAVVERFGSGADGDTRHSGDVVDGRCVRGARDVRTARSALRV